LQITKFALPIFVLPDYVKFTSAYKFPKLPLHSIKGLSDPSGHVSSEFMSWLSGFTDAEGSFSIVPNKDKQTIKFQFRIRLHKDDHSVLDNIAKTLGIGSVFMDKNSVVFQVSSNDEIKSVIIPIFKAFPLRTTKVYDFDKFCQAVDLKLTSGSYTDTLFKQTLDLKDQMNTQRNPSLLSEASVIDPYWFIGFIEGEGTFGIKASGPYFQYAQLASNNALLDSMSQFLNKLPRAIYTPFLHYIPEASKPSVNLNKRTNVITYSYASIDFFYDYLLPFFLAGKFYTRKYVDFYLWTIVIICTRFGFSKLPEGIKLIRRISGCINEARYSTATIQSDIVTQAEINAVFALDSPYGKTEILLSHSTEQNARLLSPGRSGKQINVYENNGKIMEGSPFNSQADVAEALGLDRDTGSTLVGRYLKSGKAYKDRYTFHYIGVKKG